MDILITGGSRGLGFAIAKFALTLGGKVGIISNNLERLEQAKAELGADLHIFSCDFANPDNLINLLPTIQNTFPKVDMLVNNVGYFDMAELEETRLTLVEEMMNINFKTAFTLTQAYLGCFKHQKSGFIFNIGSIVTKHPRKDVAAYTISKFALSGYTKLLIDDLKDDHVKVTEIIPGSINTTSWDGIDAPKEDFVQVEDIVESIKMVINSSKGANFEEILIRPTNRNF